MTRRSSGEERCQFLLPPVNSVIPSKKKPQELIANRMMFVQGGVCPHELRPEQNKGESYEFTTHCFSSHQLNVCWNHQRRDQSGLCSSALRSLWMTKTREFWFMQLQIKEMNARDEITIRTEFSRYCFRLTDPVQCRGFLSGGPLGTQQHKALFAGTNTQADDWTQLETGHRAIFIVAGKRIKRLVTSIISEISVLAVSADLEKLSLTYLNLERKIR